MNLVNAPAVTKTYSLTLEHIGKVADMAARTGKSQGEIVRMAIDLLYEKMEREEAKAPSPTAGQARCL